MKNLLNQFGNKGLISAMVILIIAGIALAVWVNLPPAESESQQSSSYMESKEESKRVYSVPDIVPNKKVSESKNAESKDESSQVPDENSNATDVSGDVSSTPPTTSTPQKDDTSNTSAAPTVNDSKTEPTPKPDETPSQPSNSNPPTNKRGGDPSSPFYKGGDNPFDNDQTTSVDYSPADETSGKAGEGIKF